MSLGYCQKGYALSARSFSQVETPLGLAFRLYSAFSALVQRTWICSVARSLGGRGGRPLPRVGLSMSVIVPTQIILDKVNLGVYSVYTLNQPKEKQMIKVTFAVNSKILNKSFVNVELHRSMEEANLRALALGWRIVKTEAA